MLIYFLNSNPKQEVMPHHVKLFSWDFINFYHFAPPQLVVYVFFPVETSSGSVRSPILPRRRGRSRIGFR